MEAGPFPDDPNPLQLKLFSPAVAESHGARCLDGSPLSTPRRGLEPHGRRRA